MIKKAIIIVLVVALSLGLSLFILPSEIHIIRFVDISASPDRVWSRVSEAKKWNEWWEGSSNSEMIEWVDGASLTITEADTKRRKVAYEVSATDGKGSLTIDLSPEAMDDISDNDKVSITWEHRYNVGYNPFDRLSHWLSRGPRLFRRPRMRMPGF